MERQANKPPADKLLVQVHYATGLRGSRNDAHPFVEVFFKKFARRDAAVGETAVRKNTLQPNWEDHPPLELQVPSRAQKGAGLPLVFHVLDYDWIGRNDILGEAQLAADDWRRGCSRVELQLKQQQVDGSASRSGSDKKASGTIVVSCEWADGRTHETSAAGNLAHNGASSEVADQDPQTPTDANRQDLGAKSVGHRNNSRWRSVVGSGDPQDDDATLPSSQLPLGPCEVFVRVHEGRDFGSADQRSRTGDSLIKVTFNEETHPTHAVGHTNNPVWNDRTSFHFEVARSNDLHGLQMRFEAWDSDYFADDLIGAFELDLAWVWQQEHHEIQQTWVALADTKVRGYLLVSVAIVPEGFELNTVAPVRDGPADLSVALLPPSVEVTVKELHVKVYYAEDVVALDEDGANDLYARVSYGNQSVQSSVVQNSVWQEALMVPVVSPRLDREMVSQRVKLALCDGDHLGRDDVVGVAYINLADVPQLGDSPHSKMWGVPTWLDLYGAPAHAGGSSNEGGSKLLRKFGQQFESSRGELTRQMNSGVLPGSAYRGRVMICAFLQDVNEARIGVLKMPDIQKVHPSGHAREVAELTRLRLESLVSAPIKQKDTRQTRLPQSRWRDMSLDQHNPESSKATPGSLLVCLASDAGVPRPVPSRSQPRGAPEHGLCAIRALILEGHDLQRTAKLRSQWASINLRVGAATVSTRRVELQDDDSETFGCSSRVQWNELLQLVVACPKGRDGRLLPPDAFLELMLGSAFGEQKRLSYTRIDASEFLKLNPDCLIQETLSKELYKDTVFGAGYIPWTANAFGVRCVNGTNLHKTDKFSNPDYYVRVTLYSGPDGQVPTPDKIRQEQQVSSLSYSAPSRTQDVQLNKDGVAVWDELFRFGTPQPAGEYTMPGVRVVVVDVFDEDTGRDDHVGRAVIRVRNTDHGYEVDHSGTSGERDFRPVDDTNVHGWPLFYYTGESRRQQGTINLVFTQHAFVPEKEWSYDNDVETYEMRVHVFSAQQLRLQDSDGVNEVFVRASMGSSTGRTMDGRSKPFTKTRSGPGPVWNQTLVFDDVQLMPPEWIQAGLSPRLVLTLWDRDTGSTPDFLARCCISPAQIFEASSKMDSYIARESGQLGHPARWYPLVEQDCATRAGNVLLAFEICKSAEAGERTWLDSTFSDKQRSSGKCTPPVRKCRLEMLVVGCRNLKSWGLTEPTAPYVELSVSNKKGGVGKSASTMPRRKPRPTSPSYVDDRLLILECELPEDTLFEPHAIATIRDSDGKYTPGAKKMLGYSRIDLSQHLPWVQQNQESRSRQLVDQMVREQKVRARKRNLCRLSIGGSDPQLCAALEMDEVEPWDELPLAKLDLERTLYALLIAEEQFESYRAIKPDDEFVIRKHQSLVDQALVQCEKIAATALQLVEFNLRQNPAAENQTLQLWRVIETDRPYSRGMQQFEALPLVIDSTAADDVRGSADADDVKDFRRHALLAEQLGMKLCLICCERLAVAVASDVPAHDEPSLLTRGAAALHDIDTLAQKCDAYVMCIRESAKSFGKIGKQTSRHANLTKLMASECLGQCRALLMEADDGAKTKAIQSVCSALEDKVKALEMLPDLVASGSGADTPACQSSCEKLACCWCNGVAEQPQFRRLAETDINQLVAAVGHERLDFHYNLPMWMLNRKVIDDELEDELDRLSTSFRTMMTWRIVDSDGEVGSLKGVIRVVDISADSSEPQPEPEPETDMFGNRPVAAVSHIPTNSVMELPFPRLLPELLRNFELIARVYVTQAFLSFQDSSRLLGADADWYIKVFLNGDSLDQSVSVTAGDPTRPYLGCMFEFPVLLPGPSALRLELHDRDKFSHDELIGATDIDLEDRYFNEGWRALGQPVHATTSILAQIASNGLAQAATADDIHAQKTPSPSKFSGCSRLLSLMSSSNRNTTGSDEDQEPLQAVEVGRASVEGSHSVPADADAELDLEREDDSQLTLQKPIERRTLRLPGSKRLQGKLETWIDLLTKPQAALLDPVDIRPPQIQRFELRVVVWSVRTCPISDWLTSASDLTVSTDLHVVESEDEREPTLLTQDTDTHWRSSDGEGHFNWRIVFSDLPLPQPLNSPCRLSLNVWDSDPLHVSKELVGTAEVDMRKLLFRKATSRAASAKHNRVLLSSIRAMSTKRLRHELRQLGEHYDPSATRAELATALEYLLVHHDSEEVRFPEKFPKFVAYRCCCCDNKVLRQTAVERARPPRRCVRLWRCCRGCCVEEHPFRPVPSIWLPLRPPRPSIHRRRKRKDDNGDGVYDSTASDEEEAGAAVDGSDMAIEVSFEILASGLAEKKPVGRGRAEPNQYPKLHEPPARTEVDWGKPVRKLNVMLGRRLCALVTVSLIGLFAWIILGIGLEKAMESLIDWLFSR